MTGEGFALEIKQMARGRLRRRYCLATGSFVPPAGLVHVLNAAEHFACSILPASPFHLSAAAWQSSEICWHWAYFEPLPFFACCAFEEAIESKIRAISLLDLPPSGGSDQSAPVPSVPRWA